MQLLWEIIHFIYLKMIRFDH